MASQELIHLGPFEGIDQTTSSYYVEPKYALDGLNFDPSRYYDALSPLRGRKKSVVPAGVVKASGLCFMFYRAFSYQPFSVNVIQYQSPGGFFTSAVGVAPTAIPRNPSIYPAAPIGTSAKMVTSAGFVFATTNGAGVQGLGDIPLKWAGGAAQLQAWQIAPPGAPISVSATGSGGLFGAYYYRVTFMNSVTGQESSPGPAYGPYGPPSPVTANNQNINITLNTNLIQTSALDPQIDLVNVYRLGGTSSQWTFVGSVASAALANGVTFTDTTSDVNLIGQNLILHRDPPPNFNAICVHKSRIWGLGYNYPYPWSYTAANNFATIPSQPSDLWFTVYNEPWSFDCVNQVIPLDRENNGDTGVDLQSIGSVLLAYKRKSTWAVYGDTAEDFYAIKIFDIGAIPGTVAGWGNSNFFGSETGIYFTDGQSKQNVSDGSEDAGGISLLIGKLLSNPTSVFSSFIYNQTYFIFEWTTKVGYGYYIPSARWFTVGYPVTSLVACSPEDGLLYVPDPNTGLSLDQWFTQDNDDYGPISFTWTSGNYDSGAPQYRKVYEHAILQIPQGDKTSSFNIQFYIDGQLALSSTLNPRSVGDPGGSYYRLSFPRGSKGVNMQVAIQGMQAGASVLLMDRLSVYGTIDEEIAPVYVNPNGST